jgi:hypothetical protein
VESDIILSSIHLVLSHWVQFHRHFSFGYWLLIMAISEQIRREACPNSYHFWKKIALRGGCHGRFFAFRLSGVLMNTLAAPKFANRQGHPLPAPAIINWVFAPDGPWTAFLLSDGIS